LNLRLLFSEISQKPQLTKLGLLLFSSQPKGPKDRVRFQNPRGQHPGLGRARREDAVIWLVRGMEILHRSMYPCCVAQCPGTG